MLSCSTKVLCPSFHLSRKPRLLCIYFSCLLAPVFYWDLHNWFPVHNYWWHLMEEIYYHNQQELLSESGWPKTWSWIQSYNLCLIVNLTSRSCSQASQHTPEVLILGTWALCFPPINKDQSNTTCPGMCAKSEKMGVRRVLETDRWVGSYREPGKTKMKKREVQNKRSCSLLQSQYFPVSCQFTSNGTGLSLIMKARP